MRFDDFDREYTPPTTKDTCEPCGVAPPGKKTVQGCQNLEATGIPGVFILVEGNMAYYATITDDGRTVKLDDDEVWGV